MNQTQGLQDQPKQGITTRLTKVVNNQTD